MADHQPNPNGHEEHDAPVWPIVWAGVGLVVGTALAAIVAFGVFAYFVGRPSPAPMNPMAAERQEFPPTPRLEVHPAIEMGDLRAQEAERLNSYGWVDRDAGKIHIPLSRAMQLQLERGFPTRKVQPQ